MVTALRTQHLVDTLRRAALLRALIVRHLGRLRRRYLSPRRIATVVLAYREVFLAEYHLTVGAREREKFQFVAVSMLAFRT